MNNEQDYPVWTELTRPKSQFWFGLNLNQNHTKSFASVQVLNHHKHHHNLICSTYEFIIVAKSSRVAVFFTCNVIIITTIFLGSLKSPTGGDSDQLFSLSTTSVLHETDGAKEKENDGDFDIDDDGGGGDDGDDDDEEEEEGEEEEEFHGYDGYDEDNDDDVNAEDVDSEEDDDDEIDSNDLQMRIEEFINKVYKKRKEEIIAERLLCIAATEFN
ncbi:hypothetical protein Ddye_018025 [Dipteronia dyeriana]|uniref:Uncharacterized protein n=1 Tax=Dipteronia dyeriana TaxID=168575 RepID=A0AAD9X128_9ROSI|nr:hypothetical protein Ddye_018025 [Dipteronia dyeriana]